MSSFYSTIKKAFLFVCLTMLLVSQSWASGLVKFQVNNLEGERAMVINLYMSELLSNFNIAADEGKLPDINEPEFITQKAWNNLKTAWQTNYSFRCPESVVIGSAENSRVYPDEYEIRHIPLVLNNPNAKGGENYQEATVHLSRKNGYYKITDFTLSLEPEVYQEVVLMSSNAKEVDEMSNILNYLERFRNAYCIKDIDFLEQVFSDDALILSGRLVTRKKNDETVKEIKTTKFTKEQYIKNLRGVFQRNAHIDVTFTDIKVEKHPTVEGVYGVQLFQGYRSSTYSDEGYLFLLWDFRGENPQIHVRSWQDKNIWKEYPNTKRHSLEDFSIDEY